MSLGVVPLATSAWNPDMAPQATVMKTNGNSVPPNTGPLPSMNCVSAGIFSCGCVSTMATASSATVPSLRKVDR